MATAPTVTVAVITRNNAAQLERLLLSLARGTRLPDETVVVNNGSTDQTQPLLERLTHQLPQLALRVVPEPRPGRSHARNSALDHAHGTLVAFTDDDCIVDRHWLEQLVRALVRHPDAAAAGGNTLAVGNSVIGLTGHLHRQLITLRDIEADALLLGRQQLATSLATQNICYRSAALGDLRFDTRLQDCEAVELAWRLQQRAPQGILYAPGAIVWHEYPGELRRMLRRHLAYGRGARGMHALAEAGGYRPAMRRTPLLRRARRSLWLTLTLVRQTDLEPWRQGLLWLLLGVNDLVELAGYLSLRDAGGRRDGRQPPSRAAAPRPAPSPRIAALGSAAEVISVIVITRNRPQKLRRCLRSLQRQQGCPPVELLVVDDGPCAETAEICAQLGDQRRPVHRLHGPFGGPAAARNAGLAAAHGAFVAFVDDDCVAEPSWLATLHDCLLRTGAQAVTGRTSAADSATRWARAFDAMVEYWIDHTRFDEPPLRRALCPRRTSRDGGPVHYAPTNNIELRAEVFSTVGLFDERLGRGAGEDVLQAWRMLQHGMQIVHCPRARVCHEHRADRAALMAQMRWWGEGMARIKELYPDFYLDVTRGPLQLLLHYGSPLLLPVVLPLMTRWSNARYADIIFAQELWRRWSLDRACRRRERENG